VQVASQIEILDLINRRLDAIEDTQKEGIAKLERLVSFQDQTGKGIEATLHAVRLAMERLVALQEAAQARSLADAANAAAIEKARIEARASVWKALTPGSVVTVVTAVTGILAWVAAVFGWKVPPPPDVTP